MKKDITELYSFIDDFYKIYYEYEKKKLLPTEKQRNRRCDMSLSEIMTIMVMYHTSYAKNFKYNFLNKCRIHMTSPNPKPNEHIEKRLDEYCITQVIIMLFSSMESGE